METLIVVCLLIIICLLLHDKITIKKANRKNKKLDSYIPDPSGVIGQPKPKERHLLPTKAIGGHGKKPAKDNNSFDPETGGDGLTIVIPQEERDEVLGEEPDFSSEEEEWSGYGEPNGEDGFATGVTFEELSTVGALLQQERLEPALRKQAVDIVHKIQGTELLSLLENSIENASRKIARLLDKSIETETDSGSSPMRKKALDDFDIDAFL